MDFVKNFKVDGLDHDVILSTNVFYKFLVRVVKSVILSMKNMSQYIITFMCMFLMVYGILVMPSLACRCLVCVVLPLSAEVIRM